MRIEKVIDTFHYAIKCNCGSMMHRHKGMPPGWRCKKCGETLSDEAFDLLKDGGMN